MVKNSADPPLSSNLFIANNRVLLIEHEPLYAKQLQTLLLSLGYDPVGSATAAHEVLACYQAEPTELAFLDIGLRGPLDGVQLVEHLLAHAPIPVVFLTSFADDNTFQRA